MKPLILKSYVNHRGGINNLEVNQVILGYQVQAIYTGKTSSARAKSFAKLFF